MIIDDANDDMRWFMVLNGGSLRFVMVDDAY